MFFRRSPWVGSRSMQDTMFDKLGNLSGLLKQAQQMQDDLKRVQAELAEKTVEGSAGGGLVTAEVNGRQELVAVRIDPQAVNPDDVEMLEDLVVAAVSQAMSKSQEMAKEAVASIAGGLPPIPGLTA